MSTLFNLSNRLRELAERQVPASTVQFQPPSLEDWLRYWNDEDSELGNLRNLQYWLDRRREHWTRESITRLRPDAEQ